MTVVKIGDLRDRLGLEEPVYASDGGGGVVSSWQSVSTFWGQIVPKGGRESVAGGRLSGSVSHEIFVRYRADIKPTMRLVSEGRVFEILAVLHPSGKKDWLKCMVAERDL